MSARPPGSLAACFAATKQNDVDAAFTLDREKIARLEIS